MATFRRNGRYVHVPDRRPGIIPVEHHRADRQEARDMAAKHHRPCWDDVERVIRLLINVADEVARLINALHR
jgi:hypothetical protein